MKFFSLLFLISLIAVTTLANNKEVKLNKGSWKSLSFNKIPAHELQFLDAGMKVIVKSSAGPLVYKLDSNLKINAIKIKGKITGHKKMENTSFDEDSILRVGLVATGSQKLTGVKKWMAAAWVKELFALAPEGTGLDKIYFFNTTNRDDLVGKKRIHPSSGLLSENIVWLNKSEGTFNFTHKLDKPINTAALWLSIDGDDSSSEFQVLLQNIELETTDTISPE